ncbi:MAG: tRNA (guanosine(37)-N1)-methyltransferase TrmD [Tissierellia bacterium]|nr:tRNA (guanosine(37)-N1)-methyltransferase TrmD [Tissierellia bacterium]
MKIDILTLFPEFFQALTNFSIIGRAIEKGLFSFNTVNIRDFSKDKHKRVDDYPFGGGPGMVMKPEPIYDALLSVKDNDSFVIYLSPQGILYNQEVAKKLASKKHLILICGHYEGIDNRIVENYVDMELSIGDYVLTGGEIPAMVVVDSIVRLIPGVLSSQEAYMDESHYNGLLEYPQYTRPREFNEFKVPEVLLSGNHEEIRKWRKYQSLKNTYIKRPDLLEKRKLSKEEIAMLEEIKKLI